VAKHVHDEKWIESLKKYYPDREKFGRDDTGVVQLLNSFLHIGLYYIKDHTEITFAWYLRF
jgi:hypothetical protein